MGRRILYALIGAAAGSVIGLLLHVLGVPPVLSTQCGMIGALLARWYAERRGKVPTAEELHRPTSLFGNADRRSSERRASGPKSG